MLAVASNSTSAAQPWQTASSSTESSPQLSSGCALLAILVQTQSSSQSGEKVDIELGAKKLEELKKQLADAIQQAKDAANDSGFFGFLGDIFGSDIAQIAGAIAAVAAVVATGGAGAPVLLIAISESLQVGAKVGAELGLDPKLCMAISLASVAVGFACGTGAAQASSALANGARDIEVGAKVIQGGATIAGGVLHGAAAYYHRNQLNHQADATGYHAAEDVTDLSIDDALARLQRALRTQQSETSTASEIVQNNSDTNTALSDRI